MFTLLPNATSPASAWIGQHGALVIMATLALIAFAVVVRYANPRDDYSYLDFSGKTDCDDGDGGGDCSAD